MRILKFLPAAITLLIFLISCQDDPTSLGKDFIGSDLEILLLDSETDSLNQNSSSFLADSVSFGPSTRLVLGSVENRKSTMLMRFGVLLPDSIRTAVQDNNLNIISAEVELRPAYRIGDPGQTIDFTVHNITSDWGSNKFDKDSLAMLTYDLEEVTQSKEVSDSLISFKVNSEIAFEWLEALIDTELGNNYGMIFIPQTGINRAYGFRGFPQTTNDNSPLLRYVVENENNKIDTLIARVVFDVHIVEGTPEPVADDKLQLTAGLGERGKIFFDLDKLPNNANVNRAELVLNVDSASSLVGNVVSDSLRVRLFADSLTNEINTEYALNRITFDGKQFKGDITKLVQAVNLGADNQGFRLVLGNEEESLDRYVVYGSNYSDKSFRPKLKIYYNLIR